jgi:hypothetical protein
MRTLYFHAIANGRRRKCSVLSLVTDEGPTQDNNAIQTHIYNFYIELLGTEEPKFLSLSHNFWGTAGKVSATKNDELELSFLPKEIDLVLQSTVIDMALEPAIGNGFALGRIDNSRLNFGVLSLIPKVPG